MSGKKHPHAYAAMKSMIEGSKEEKPVSEMTSDECREELTRSAQEMGLYDIPTLNKDHTPEEREEYFKQGMIRLGQDPYKEVGSRVDSDGWIAVEFTPPVDRKMVEEAYSELDEAMQYFIHGRAGSHVRDAFLNLKYALGKEESED